MLGCWASARRKFVTALEVNLLFKQLKELSKVEQQELVKKNPSYRNILNVLEKIKYLFQFEEEYTKKNYEPEEIRKGRQSTQKKQLDDLFQYLEKLQEEYLPKSKMEIAISYAVNLKNDLFNYINDGSAEISNNRGERMIKPIVIGRKAWLFSNTKSGAKCSSIYYSLIESAKLNYLDIHEYLEYVLDELTNINNPKEEDYRKLLPYSKELPSRIRCKSK